MKSQDQIKLEKSIIRLVKSGRATTMAQLLAKLWKEPYSESFIRQTVWRLVDRGELAFNEQRKFEINIP